MILFKRFKRGRFEVRWDVRRHVCKLCLSLGVSFGSNWDVRGVPRNLFLEFDFLLWRGGLEVRIEPKPRQIVLPACGCPYKRDAGECLRRQGAPGAGGSFGDWCECECHKP